MDQESENQGRITFQAVWRYFRLSPEYCIDETSLSRKNRKPPPSNRQARLLQKRRLPTLPLLRSTIGVTRLNFSVRNGKRWNPRAITTWIRLWHDEKVKIKSITDVSVSRFCSSNPLNVYKQTVQSWKKVNGQLVMLGYDVTTCTPASYQRHRLWRP